MGRIGNDDEVARPARPRHVTDRQNDPAMQNLHCRFARILMLGQSLVCPQGNDRLAQEMLVTAIHGLRASATRSNARRIQLGPCQSSQRCLLHSVTSIACGAAWADSAHSSAARVGGFEPRCTSHRRKACSLTSGFPSRSGVASTIRRRVNRTRKRGRS